MNNTSLSDYLRRLQYIQFQERINNLDYYIELRYNHNHDQKGRFCSGGGGGRLSSEKKLYSNGGANPEKAVDNSEKNDIIKETKSGLIITKSQFGKKVGKHAIEFGLNPNDKSSRNKVLDIISDIHAKPDLTVEGLWRGQGELNENGLGNKSGKVTFFIKGTSVVVTKNNKFITIMKNGLNNGNVKKAIENCKKDED